VVPPAPGWPRPRSVSDGMRTLTLVIALSALSALSAFRAAAQNPTASVSFGAGAASWSGPGERRARSSLEIGAAVEWRAAPMIGLRVEGALRRLTAQVHWTDSGGGTWLPWDVTSLTTTNASLGMAARVYPLGERRHSLLFIDLAVAHGRQIACEVKITGGFDRISSSNPCAEWLPGSSIGVDVQRFGTVMALGAGLSWRRVGLHFRYTPRPVLVARTETSALEARLLTILAEVRLSSRDPSGHSSGNQPERARSSLPLPSRSRPL